MSKSLPVRDINVRWVEGNSPSTPCIRMNVNFERPAGKRVAVTKYIDVLMLKHSVPGETFEMAQFAEEIARKGLPVPECGPATESESSFDPNEIALMLDLVNRRIIEADKDGVPRDFSSSVLRDKLCRKLIKMKSQNDRDMDSLVYPLEQTIRAEHSNRGRLGKLPLLRFTNDETGESKIVDVNKGPGGIDSK